MATFLSSVLAAALSQAPGGAPPPTAPDAIAAAQARLARDSADGRAWLALGRAYLTAFEEAQAPRARPDSSTPRAALDGAEQGPPRAAALLRPAGASAEGAGARRWEDRAARGRGRRGGGAGTAPPGVREHGVGATATTPRPRRDAVGAAAARVGGGTGAGGPGPVRGLRVRRAEAGARRPRGLGASGAPGLRPRRPPDADVVRDAGDIRDHRGHGRMRHLRHQTSDVRLQLRHRMSDV